VLLKGIGEKSVANDVKNVLEMVLYCFFPLIYMNFILDCHKPGTPFLRVRKSNIHYLCQKLRSSLAFDPCLGCCPFEFVVG
jgi:hypothetical protein